MQKNQENLLNSSVEKPGSVWGTKKVEAVSLLNYMSTLVLISKIKCC